MTDRPFDAYRRRKLDQIAARYDALLQAGFPIAGYPGELLQCRDEMDRSNWFEVRDLCRELIASDPLLANAPFPDPGLRCASNNFVQPTLGEVLAILAGMRSWVFAGQLNLWRLKDAVEACASREAMNAIDIEGGW